MTSLMEAVIPAAVAHSRLLQLQQQGPEYAKTERTCKKFSAFRRTLGSVRIDLSGDFRRCQQSKVFLRSCNGRVARGQKQCSFSAKDTSTTQPFDYEYFNGSRELEESSRKLKVGIVGFGNFGQFLAERILRQGHKVLAHSRRDYSDKARKLGVIYFKDADDFCEEHPEVVLLCTSILSTEAVLLSLPLQRLKRNTLFVDVLSVKEFPKNLFLQMLPPEFDVLCTHPMFGPHSGKASWAGLPVVYDKVRICNGRQSRSAELFLDIFASEGCRMVEMSCAEHDRFAAGSQFITHTVGRILGKLGLESTPINTQGYETLLELVQNTSGDSFELYHGLFMYNPNATDELERFEIAFDSIKKQLFGQLHNVLKKQLIGGVIATKGCNLSQSFVNSSLEDGSSSLGTLFNGGIEIMHNYERDAIL